MMRGFLLGLTALLISGMAIAQKAHSFEVKNGQFIYDLSLIHI